MVMNSEASCVFCKIAAGDIPSHKLYEDEHVLAFLDLHPVHPGHALIIPKRHSKNIFEVSPEDWSAVAETTRKLAHAVDLSLESDGINVMMNNREHAGQTVHHAHVHVIPRFKGDGLRLWPQRSYKEGEAEAIAAKIRAAL